MLKNAVNTCGQRISFRHIPAIATENLLMYFSLSSQHVSAPLDHPQVKHNLLLMYLEKAIVITTDPLFTIFLLLSIYTTASVV
jgi:hypothetical protein